MNQPAPPAASELPIETIQTAHRRATTIVAAIGFSLIAYVLVVELLRNSQPDAMPVAQAGTLRMAFFAVAVSAIFMATVIKAMLLRTAPPTPVARLMRLQTTSILAAALAELPAVLGVVLFLLTRTRSDFYMLLVVSAYMIVRHFPRLETWQTYVRRGSDAR